jgi:anti-sigma B factor antagonist
VSDRASVALTGEIDLASKADMDALAEHIGPDSPNLELDLSGVTFIDSFGLGMFVMLNRTCEEHGGKLTLRSPSATVAKMLELSGLELVFPIED